VGESLHPATLPRRLDGPRVVVLARPGDGLGRLKSRQDGQAGDDRTSTTDTAPTGDLHRGARFGALVQRADLLYGLVAVTGQQEVGPIDPCVRPPQFVLVAAKQPRRTEIEAEFWLWPGRQGIAQATAAQPAAVR